MEADQDRDGKISFDEFTKMVENTDVSMSMTLGKLFLASCHISNQEISYMLQNDSGHVPSWVHWPLIKYKE